MKNEGTVFLAGLGGVILSLVFGVLLSLYSIYLIHCIVEWYHVPITLTTPQWYGIMAIITIVTWKKEPESKSDNSFWATIFAELIARFVLITLSLGLLYLTKGFIN